MFSPLVKFELQRDVKWGLLRSVRSEMFIAQRLEPPAPSAKTNNSEL